MQLVRRSSPERKSPGSKDASVIEEAGGLADMSHTWTLRSRVLCVLTVGASRLCARGGKKRGRRGWCRYMCGPVVHPDSRFRSGWNVALAFFICYCGIGVPLVLGRRIAPPSMNFFSDFMAELDAFADDAVGRRMGNGAKFYGKRKSSF